MTREEKIAEAQRLLRLGWNNREIGEQLGVSAGAVWKWLHPEQAVEMARKDNARPGRKAAKRAAERQARKPCPTCGAPMGGGSAWASHAAKSCWDCHVKAENARTAEQGRLIEGWWAEGLTGREIEERLGWAKGASGTGVARLREKGYDLPPRPVGRRRAAVAA